MEIFSSCRNMPNEIWYEEEAGNDDMRMRSNLFYNSLSLLYIFLGSSFGRILPILCTAALSSAASVFWFFFQSLHISDLNTSVWTELHIAFFSWRNSSCSNCFTQRLSDMATAHFHGEWTPPFANVNMRPMWCMWLVEYAIEQASLGLPCRRY